MLPFLPEEKSNHIDFWSLTKNEGVRSLLKGDSPLHSRPAFLSRTRCPTTSETGRRARSSSRNWGENRIQPALLIRWALQYRTARGSRAERRACPGYPQGMVRYGMPKPIGPRVLRSPGLLTAANRPPLSGQTSSHLAPCPLMTQVKSKSRRDMCSIDDGTQRGGGAKIRQR